MDGFNDDECNEGKFVNGDEDKVDLADGRVDHKSIMLKCAYYCDLTYKGFTNELLLNEVKRTFPNVIFFDSSHSPGSREHEYLGESQAALAWNSRIMAVMFRGTPAAGNVNIMCHLKTWPVVTREPYGLVHTNYVRALDQIWPQMESVIDGIVERTGIKTIIYTGHSLGAAMAVVAAARSKHRATVYGFGTPRIGNHEFRDNMKSRVFRIVNGNDFVSQVPPPLIIFRHVGQKYHIIDGEIHEPKTKWQEFKLNLRVWLSNRLYKNWIADHYTDRYRDNLEQIFKSDDRN